METTHTWSPIHDLQERKNQEFDDYENFEFLGLTEDQLPGENKNRTPQVTVTKEFNFRFVDFKSKNQYYDTGSVDTNRYYFNASTVTPNTMRTQPNSQGTSSLTSDLCDLRPEILQALRDKQNDSDFLSLLGLALPFTPPAGDSMNTSETS